MASALSIPDPCDPTGKEPKFYSDEVTAVGREMTIYAFDINPVLPTWAQALLCAVGILGGGIGAYYCNRYDTATKEK